MLWNRPSKPVIIVPRLKARKAIVTSPRLAIVGATGAVGRELLGILSQRSFDAGAVRVCASERSWGMTLPFDGAVLTVEEATPELLSESDIVFIAAGGDTSRAWRPSRSTPAPSSVDKSSAFRMDPDVPLVIPEINGDALDRHRGIVASPNCSTTPLAMVLNALMPLGAVERVVVSTYQSVSGAGAEAVRELRLQSAEILDGRAAEPRALPHQIAFNVLPHVETFQEDGYTTEETKMVNETRKILHDPELLVSATCVRVPVPVGHSEAVHVEFANAVTAEQARRALAEAPGIRVLDDPAAGVYPMPVDAEGEDDVLVGRIRQDISHPRGLALWLSSDNLRKGAALNSVQIAEELVRRDLLAFDRRPERAVASL